MRLAISLIVACAFMIHGDGAYAQPQLCRTGGDTLEFGGADQLDVWFWNCGDSTFALASFANPTPPFGCATSAGGMPFDLFPADSLWATYTCILDDTTGDFWGTLPIVVCCYGYPDDTLMQITLHQYIPPDTGAQHELCRTGPDTLEIAWNNIVDISFWNCGGDSFSIFEYEPPLPFVSPWHPVEWPVTLYPNDSIPIPVGLPPSDTTGEFNRTWVIRGAWNDEPLEVLIEIPLYAFIEATATPAPVPSEFMLLQNYPNPFNAATTIEFVLPDAADVTLTLHNLLGEEVATLSDGMMSAGVHRVNFDAAGLSSGIYFYRLQAGEKMMQRKMAVIR